MDMIRLILTRKVPEGAGDINSMLNDVISFRK